MKRSLLVGSLVLALFACSDDNTGPSDDEIPGTYELQTVDGQNLPFTIVEVGADRIEILSDAITLNAGGTFTQVSSYRITEDGETRTETENDAGDWTRDGGSITVTFDSDGSSATGVIDGDEITVEVTGFTLVYSK